MTTKPNISAFPYGMGITAKIKFNSKGMTHGVAAMAMAVAQTFTVSLTYAQDAELRTYHILSGPLDRTVIDIAKDAQLSISYDASLVRSLKSAPVNGAYSAEDALRQALRGTGLDLVRMNGRYAVVRFTVDGK
ncbi:MAG: STN domain-containing protein [Paraburkholderia tropica]|uniref:STN domain-containing protein n=1 Tax=Burkholderia gladioli TaxID=28095 RepID=UPI001FC7E00B|nr:STN domain-containing protein [Burkholderia gladioli]MDN7499961.1 STN domain-containing protein [Burkholderia gladioli]